MATARSWGYAVLLSRFFLLFLDSGTAKSFGVFLPKMVQRLDSDYATVGFICSLPATLVYLFFPVSMLILQKFSARSVAMSGGVLSGSSIFACAFMKTTATVGICLALSGVGLSMAFVPSVMTLNEYFPEKFVFMNTVAMYGYTVGSALLPVIAEQAVQAYGYTGAFIILGGISFNVVVCGATLRKSSRNIVTNAQGEPHHAEEEEKERLMRGVSSQHSLEMIYQDGDHNTGDKERGMEQRDLRDCIAEGESNIMDTRTDNGHVKPVADMVNQGSSGWSSQGPKTRSTDFDPQIEKGYDETEDTMIDQSFPMLNETQNNGVPCDLPSETSPQSSPATSLLRTCKESCRILDEPLFLFSLPSLFLVSYATYAWMYFLVPHAEQLGITGSRAVFLSTVGGIGGVIGRTLFMVLIGKGVNAFVVYIAVSIICTTTFLLDFISSAYEVRAVLAFLQGFSFFIEDTLLAALSKAVIVDGRNFGMAYTICGFSVGIATICSGIFTGYLFDVTQSFTKVFIIIGFTHAITAVHLIIVTILLKKRK